MKKQRILARKLVLLFPENANYYSLLAISNQNLGKKHQKPMRHTTMKEHIVNNNYRAVRILKNILKEDWITIKEQKLSQKSHNISIDNTLWKETEIQQNEKSPEKLIHWSLSTMIIMPNYANRHGQRHFKFALVFTGILWNIFSLIVCVSFFNPFFGLFVILAFIHEESNIWGYHNSFT